MRCFIEILQSSMNGSTAGTAQYSPEAPITQESWRRGHHIRAAEAVKWQASRPALRARTVRSATRRRLRACAPRPQVNARSANSCAIHASWAASARPVWDRQAGATSSIGSPPACERRGRMRPARCLRRAGGRRALRGRDERNAVPTDRSAHRWRRLHRRAACWELGLEVRDYRVRYSATGMDTGRRKNVREDDEPQTDDRYLLQFWPAPPGPARLLKQTSRAAASWQDFATSPVG